MLFVAYAIKSDPRGLSRGAFTHTIASTQREIRFKDARICLKDSAGPLLSCLFVSLSSQHGAFMSVPVRDHSMKLLGGKGLG